jgi:hypothetical protein
VILDKWHLKEGQDAFAFMERMATDPEVSKVLLICDKGYVERADRREGGVGTEAQIVSPQVYANSDQTKFAAAVVELDGEGRPYLPAYMRGKIYFDLSSDSSSSENYEKIVRWIFGKSFYAVPPIGSAPEFLNETHTANVATSQSLFAMRASRHTGGPRLQAAAASVLDSALRATESLRLNLVKDPEADERVVETIKGSIPLRDQVLEALDSIIRSNSLEGRDQIHQFFEGVLGLADFTPLNVQYSNFDNDAIKFLGNSWLLGFIALALKNRQFQFAADVLAIPLYKPGYEGRTGEGTDYGDFTNYIRSLDHRNQRLNLNRVSAYADLMSDVSDQSFVGFPAILEADFILYLRFILGDKFGMYMPRWYPATLVFASRGAGAFPTFVHAASKTFYGRLQPLLCGLASTQVQSALADFRTGQRKNLQFNYWDVDVPSLANMDKLGSL